MIETSLSVDDKRRLLSTAYSFAHFADCKCQLFYTDIMSEWPYFATMHHSFFLSNYIIRPTENLQRRCSSTKIIETVVIVSDVTHTSGPLAKKYWHGRTARGLPREELFVPQPCVDPESTFVGVFQPALAENAILEQPQRRLQRIQPLISWCTCFSVPAQSFLAWSCRRRWCTQTFTDVIRRRFWTSFQLVCTSRGSVTTQLRQAVRTGLSKSGEFYSYRAEYQRENWKRFDNVGCINKTLFTIKLFLEKEKMKNAQIGWDLTKLSHNVENLIFDRSFL